MKKVFIYLLVSTTLLASNGFCRDGSIEINQNPSVSLSPQDVPIFYDNHPLTDLKAFTVITSFPLKKIEMQRRIKKSIEKSLVEIGEVIRLKDNDMRGFGAGNVFLIQMSHLIGSNGSQMPVCRFSLSIQTPVSIDKTTIKTFPIVWSINTFLQGNIESQPESDLTKAHQKLISDFFQSYRYANPDQTNDLATIF